MLPGVGAFAACADGLGAVPGMVEALTERPKLPFPAADLHEAWLCNADGAPLALLATACDEAECEARKPGPWTCLPATDHGFSSCSSLAQGLGGNAVRGAGELYIGLVEFGAGVIPAGGGCLRLYQRNVAQLMDKRDLQPTFLVHIKPTGFINGSGRYK